MHENEKAFCKTKKIKKKYVNSIIILDLRILLIELIQNYPFNTNLTKLTNLKLSYYCAFIFIDPPPPEEIPHPAH